MDCRRRRYPEGTIGRGSQTPHALPKGLSLLAITSSSLLRSSNFTTTTLFAFLGLFLTHPSPASPVHPFIRLQQPLHDFTNRISAPHVYHDLTFCNRYRLSVSLLDTKTTAKGTPPVTSNICAIMSTTPSARRASVKKPSSAAASTKTAAQIENDST
jgi:hypothetical protein